MESYNKAWLGFVAIAVVAVAHRSDAVGQGRRRRIPALHGAVPASRGAADGQPDHGRRDTGRRGDEHEAGRRSRGGRPQGQQGRRSLGEDSRAIIKVTTILGSRYLALEPEGPGSLPDNTFDLGHTEVPYDLQEALADVTTTYEQVDSDKFAETLGILGKQLEGLPAVLPQALENTRTLSTIIADRRDQLGQLLQTTELVSNTLRRQQSNIGSLINQGNDLIGEFVSRRESFHAMMAALTNLVQTLSGIVIDDRPELEKLLVNIRELSDMLGKHDDLLRSTLQAGPPALRGLANATGTGNAVDLNASNGLLVDSWMCAISGRAKQFGMIEYYQDCK